MSRIFRHANRINEGDFAQNLDREFDDVERRLSRLERRSKRYFNVQLSSTKEVAVPHGFGTLIIDYSVTPTGDARVWQSRPPDRKFIYLKASSDVKADIIIRESGNAETNK